MNPECYMQVNMLLRDLMGVSLQVCSADYDYMTLRDQEKLWCSFWK